MAPSAFRMKSSSLPWPLRPFSLDLVALWLWFTLLSPSATALSLPNTPSSFLSQGLCMTVPSIWNAHHPDGNTKGFLSFLRGWLTWHLLREDFHVYPPKASLPSPFHYLLGCWLVGFPLHGTSTDLYWERFSTTISICPFQCPFISSKIIIHIDNRHCLN